MYFFNVFAFNVFEFFPGTFLYVWHTRPVRLARTYGPYTYE